MVSKCNFKVDPKLNHMDAARLICTEGTCSACMEYIKPTQKCKLGCHTMKKVASVTLKF